MCKAGILIAGPHKLSPYFVELKLLKINILCADLLDTILKVNR